MTRSDTPETPTGREFVLARTLDAPRARVFQAWTEPDRLQRWWGPKGFPLASCTIDPRPGGVFHYGLRSPQGQTMWGRWDFREVVEPERLVFVSSFSDEQGGLTRHPGMPEWPLHVLSTVTFTEHDGKTTVTMRGYPVDAADNERQAFEAAIPMMNQGWTGTLDQLAAYLAVGR
jgi:uncharacterized protein YndB with AHSA1/START domain